MARGVVASRSVFVAFLIAAAGGSLEAAPVTYASFFSAADEAIGETITADGSTTETFSDLAIFSDFGVNKLSVTGKEAAGTSAWLDEWTIVNAALTGTAGVLEVSWSLDGSLTVVEPIFCTACTDTSTIRYASLFGAGGPASPGTELVSRSQVGNGTTIVDVTGTLFVPFVYGTQFTAGFRLSGGVDDDVASGSVNFFDTAEMTRVLLPNGATLVTTSTASRYNTVEAPPDDPPTTVPEPGSLFLFGAGLIGLAVRRSNRGK